MGLLDVFGGKKQSNHYTAPVECSNCQNVGKLMIVKGTKKEAAVKDDLCNRCGCQTLTLLSDKEYLKKNPPKVESGGLF